MTKLLGKLATMDTSLVSVADRIIHLEQQFVRDGSIVTLAATRDRLDAVETRSLESEKSMQDVGRAFGVLEEKFKKDSELLNTFEKRVMGGENCDISPKDMVQYLGQSVEAVKAQFSEEVPKLGAQQQSALKDAVRTSELQTLTKLNDSLNHLSVTGTAQVENVELKVAEHESQFGMFHAKVAAMESAQSRAIAKIASLEQAQVEFRVKGGTIPFVQGTMPLHTSPVGERAGSAFDFASPAPHQSPSFEGEAFGTGTKQHDPAWDTWAGASLGGQSAEPLRAPPGVSQQLPQRFDIDRQPWQRPLLDHYDRIYDEKIAKESVFDGTNGEEWLKNKRNYFLPRAPSTDPTCSH